MLTSFQPSVTQAPEGMPGAPGGAAVEGLRTRPGLAMSQVCCRATA